MKKTVIPGMFVALLCVCNANAAMALWDWEENFDGGMDGWVNQVPDAWQVVAGDLAYSDLSGYGQRAIRHPDFFALSEGFRMEIEVDSSDVRDSYRLGILFGSNAAMTNNYEFSLKEPQGSETGPKWYLNQHIGDSQTGLGNAFTDPYSAQPHLIRVEYDGTELRCLVDGSEVTTTGVAITDGYVGVYLWDSGDSSSSATVLNVRFAAIPEPLTISLLALGCLILMRRK